MKRWLCAALILALLTSAGALAAPELSGKLVKAAKSAVGYLASGEYERLVTLLPFSGVAPGAAEWERFARNYDAISKGGKPVAYWKGGCWNIAVPVSGGDDAEALMLLSEDGSTFTVYRYATWSQAKDEYRNSDETYD